ncbi:hypothetical protein Tco_0802117, partial [Tanacetum coccineum]
MVFSAIREFVDIVKKTLEFGARGVENYGRSRRRYSHHGTILLALSREMVKPEIGGNVNFEIKSQFMRELREDTFSGNKDEDAHDHIDPVLNVVNLFNIHGVSKDTIMLRVFPFTLTGSAKRYCPPSMTAKQHEDIHNIKQEGDESLYQAWERYNDLLYKCPTHDIYSHQK